MRGSEPCLPHVAIVGRREHVSNGCLAEGLLRLGVDAAVVAPRSLVQLAPDAVAVVRLDVLQTLDGVEPGLAQVRDLELRGQRLVNRPDALIAAHDKLETAAALRAAGVPHPRTGHVARLGDPLPFDPPVVVKPRYGSWGRDVFRCETAIEAASCLQAVAERPWFRRHGALVQELVPAEPRDLRLIVAGGAVVGAAEREPAPGQWRTNVTLGGRLHAADPPAEARELAVAAAAALGTDLVGVDLLRRGDAWIVLELNGAVEFDERYSLPGLGVYRALAEALGFIPETRSAQTPMPRRRAGLMVAAGLGRSER